MRKGSRNMISNILRDTNNIIIIKTLVSMKIPHDTQSLSRIIFFNLIPNQSCHDFINYRSQTRKWKGSKNGIKHNKFSHEQLVHSNLNKKFPAEVMKMSTRRREISSWGRRPMLEWKRGTDSAISMTSLEPEMRPRRTPLTAEVRCFRAWRTSFM